MEELVVEKTKNSGTIIDTPGWGDNKSKLQKFVNLIKTFNTLCDKNKVNALHGIIFVINGADPRFDDETLELVRRLYQAFK